MTIPSPTDENISNKPNSLTVQKYHSFVRRLRLIKDGSTSVRLRIAKHHFHPKVITSEGEIFSSTDRGTGEAIGLTTCDRNKQSKGDDDYYIVGPNCSITTAEMHHNAFVGRGKPTLTRNSEEMAEKEADMKECEEKKKKQKLKAIERAELVDIHSQLDERLSKLLHDREEKIRHDYMEQIKARDSMIKELSERNEGLSKATSDRKKVHRVEEEARDVQGDLIMRRMALCKPISVQRSVWIPHFSSVEGVSEVHVRRVFKWGRRDVRSSVDY